MGSSLLKWSKFRKNIKIVKYEIYCAFDNFDALTKICFTKWLRFAQKRKFENCKSIFVFDSPFF